MSSKVVALRVRVSRESPISRTLFVKQHIPRKNEDDLPKDRTLFVANGEGLGVDEIERLLGQFGGVTSVFRSSLGHKKVVIADEDQAACEASVGGRIETTLVVFEKAQGLRAALNYSGPDLLNDQGNDEEQQPTTGLKSWVQEHLGRIVQPAELQKRIAAYMAEYDRMEDEALLQIGCLFLKHSQARKARLAPQVDDDGFELVQRRSTKKRLIKEMESTANNTGRRKRKKKEKHLLDFYRFQKREAKRDAVAQLRLKFEKDKARIAEMKSQRKFRPLDA